MLHQEEIIGTLLIADKIVNKPLIKLLTILGNNKMRNASYIQITIHFKIEPRNCSQMKKW